MFSIKTLTKVIVNRLRPTLSAYIGPFQSAFLLGRSTCGNAIILQEAINCFHKKSLRSQDMIIKIDFDKAYDNVSWNFLEQSLVDMALPQHLVHCIMWCVRSPVYSLLWNGFQTETFTPTRGLRQGDPLSPYLFVIIMETISRAIQKEVDDTTWTLVSFSAGAPPISHLIFADDLLLFSAANDSNASCISNVLHNFARAFGLRCNLTKSTALGSANVEVSAKACIAQILNIPFVPGFDKYLGFPIINGRIRIVDFDFLLYKMNSKLSNWKHRLLNKAGRTTLARSVLASVPLYYMQHLWLLQATCDRTDKVIRDFVWKNEEGIGLPLVKWERVARPCNQGGLGLRRARCMNVSLLGKLVATFLQTDFGLSFCPKYMGV